MGNTHPLVLGVVILLEGATVVRELVVRVVILLEGATPHCVLVLGFFGAT